MSSSGDPLLYVSATSILENTTSILELKPSLRPKKVKMNAKKSKSLNPSGHRLFATKKRTGPKWSNLASIVLFMICGAALPAQTDLWKSGKSANPYKKSSSFRGYNRKKLSKFLLRLRNTYKKYIFKKKNRVRTANLVLSSGQSNLQTPMWSCRRQLDDQYRNPNINNRSSGWAFN